MSPVAPLILHPTLLDVPLFAISAEPPALAPIPASATTALSTFVVEASAIADETPTASPGPSLPGSFIDGEDVEPESKGKGRASVTPKALSKAPANLAPSAPVPPPTVPSAVSATDASPAAGPSSTVHPWIENIQYDLDSKLVTRATAGSFQALQCLVDAIAMGTATLDDDLACVSYELKEAVEGMRARLRTLLSRNPGINAQLVGIEADNAEAARRAASSGDDFAIASLILASNQHTKNSGAIQGALSDVFARICNLSDRVTGLDSMVVALHGTVNALLSRFDALSSSAPPAPWAHDLALITPAADEAIHANGKRGHYDTFQDHSKRQHFATAVALPPAFIYPTAPPAPDFAAPGFALCAALAPATEYPDAAAPAAAYPFVPHVAYPFAPQAAAAAAAYRVAHPAAVLPRPPPGGRPGVRVDPACEVLFGPMDWEKNFHQTPRNLISNILGYNTIQSARFTSRKSSDESTVVLVFEASAIATWFIATWNGAPRPGYEICVARPMFLNA